MGIVIRADDDWCGVGRPQMAMHRSSQIFWLYSRDGGIMCQNPANYAQHFLGLCAEFMAVVRVIFAAICYLFFILKH